MIRVVLELDVVIKKRYEVSMGRSIHLVKPEKGTVLPEHEVWSSNDGLQISSDASKLWTFNHGPVLLTKCVTTGTQKTLNGK